METSNTNSDVVDVAKILEGSGESSIESDQEYEHEREHERTECWEWSTHNNNG